MLQKGFIQYQLAFDATNSNFALVSAPSASAVEMASLMAGMQNLWHMTAEGSDDRVAAIRQNYAANLDGATPVPAAANTADGMSVWGKLSYGEFRRDTSLSLSGLAGSLSYDTSYNQTMEALQVGVDHLVSKDADGTWVLGALIGYDTSRLHFKADANKARYTVWNFGAYASYMSGPWFGDLLVKDDLTRVKFDFPSVPGIAKRDGNSIGGKLTVGGRFADEGIDLQPMASLAYVRSSLSDVDVPGSNFNFDSGSSFRGTLGLRLSTDVDDGMVRWQPFVFAGVGQEFDAKNSVTMTSGGSSVLIADKPFRTFGIGSLGFNVLGQNGLSGFVKADGLYASHTKSFALWAGLRFAS
jgi:outer membrane autotransporter protein